MTIEYRKLISFGKSSFVVSLPKSWITQNKLKKGDLLYFEESGTNLVLQAQANSLPPEEKEISISIDGKDLRRIQREVVSAYIQNYKTIRLQGDEIKDKAKAIRSFIQNLVAMEVLEQDSKKIIAKDFLSFNDISVEQIVRKMDVITRSMLADCKNQFTEDSYESMQHRDNDVNKFRFLIYRIIWFGMENPSFVLKTLKLTQRDSFNYWWLSFSIEGIADHIKRLARYMREIKLSPKEQEKYIQVLRKIEVMYNEVMKAYYVHQVETAHKILHERFEILQACDEFYHQNRNIPLIGYLVYNTKSLIVTIHTIGRIIYQGMPG